MIDRAAQLFAAAAPSACAPLAALADVADKIAARMPGVNLHFDLCELHGYHYHTGLVFAAYVPGQGEAIANGGRYDDIGRVFGRARPATGFSIDLKTLLGLLPAADAAPRCGVFRRSRAGGCGVERDPAPARQRRAGIAGAARSAGQRML